MVISQLMLWVISELCILWKVCTTGEDKNISTETVSNHGSTSTPFVKQQRITCPSIMPMGTMEIKTSDSNLPCVNVIFRSWYKGKIWEFLKDSIPQFQMEEESLEETRTVDLLTTDSKVNEIKSESPTVPKSRGTDTDTHIAVICLLTVTAEDKKKDDSIANDKEEVKSTSGPDKETDVKDKERLQTAKESSGALLLSQDALASDKPPLLETWVDLLNFTKCFQ
ncbi:hypothetical protein cypCar_00033288 [Cyprinus carpio]|nr:hypothetical protein cypCar_00033288 [Cyprinus carpio]